MNSMFVRKTKRLGSEVVKEIRHLNAANRPRRVAFDHLPKCGGAGLNAYLELHYPRRKTFITFGDRQLCVDRFKAMHEHQRFGYELYRGHRIHELLDYVNPDCFKITVLRDPIERIISHYYYSKRDNKHYLHSQLVENNWSLYEYITLSQSNEFKNFYVTHFSRIPVGSQKNHESEAIEKAVDTLLETYDLVGFLDEFSVFLSRLQEYARLVYEYRHSKVNRTKGRPSRSEIPKSTIDKIIEMNSLDIDFFDRLIKLRADGYIDNVQKLND